ncbi:MAG: orotidine-5'-phosphate decarboxylase [Acidobacteria bacterium]|nr:orotidine-5'-phosphate decarboxylase [Acidobacteriota bacterium]
MFDSRRRLRPHPEIPSNERLIFALDVPSEDQARDLVQKLGEAVTFYKLGAELSMTGAYFKLAEDLIKQGKKVFADLKFSETPRTVAASVSQLRDIHCNFTSVMSDDPAQVKAAVEKKNGIKILAVTVLTHLDDSDLREMGFAISVDELTRRRAKKALDIGCDGLIASGLQVPLLRSEFAEENPLIVCPGIRLGDQRPKGDDQKRVVTPMQAFESGADYIVVGRPIRMASDPKKAAEAIQAQIEQFLAGSQ